MKLDETQGNVIRGEAEPRLDTRHQNGPRPSDVEPPSAARNTGAKDLLKRMRQQSDGLSASMHSIAEFLLREGSGIANLGMGQVATLSYSSKATLVRYARQLGYDGWKSFRADFIEQARLEERRSMGGAKVDLNYPFGAGADANAIAQSIVDIRRVAHDIVLGSLDTQLVDTAAELVLCAHRLVFLGNPPNRQYGELFAYNLNNIGVECRVPHNETRDQELRQLGGRDCVIVSSYSGNLSRDLGDPVRMARTRGVPLIAITGAGSPLTNICTIALEYPPLEHYYTKIGGFYSCECTALILDLLYCVCYRGNYENNKRGRANLGEALARTTSVADELAG